MAKEDLLVKNEQIEQEVTAILARTDRSSDQFLNGNGTQLKEALLVLEELELVQAKEESYQSSLKRVESALSSEEKACKDELEVTIRKRKEEVASSFDKEIRKDQDKIRKIQSDRDKAKEKGIAGRVNAETEDVRGENEQIQMDIRAILKENRMPGFCKSKWYYMLFCPKGLEHIFLLLISVVCMSAIPYGIFLYMPMKTFLTLLLLCGGCSIIYFYLYRGISNVTRSKKWAQICQIRAMQDKIVANRKKAKAIKNAIQKDRNEQGYNLEVFDNEILALEEEIKHTLSEKQEALTTFENTTKHMIAEEIQGRFAPKIDMHKIDIKQTASAQKEAEQSIREIRKFVTSNYELFMGKECVNREAIQDMITLLEDGKASTIAEALSLYKEEH